MNIYSNFVGASKDLSELSRLDEQSLIALYLNQKYSMNHRLTNTCNDMFGSERSVYQSKNGC